MSSLILPRRFTSQPQGAVEVDWSNPIAKRNLSGAWLPNGGLIDVVTGKLVTFNGSSVLAPTNNGLELYSPSNGGYATVSGSKVYAPSNQPWSFFTRFKLDSFDSQFKTIGSLRSETTYPFEIFVSSHASYLGLNIGSPSTWERQRWPGVAAGTQYSLAITYNGNGVGTLGNTKIYIDGIVVSTTTTGAFGTSGKTQNTFFSDPLTNQHFNGWLSSQITADTAWSADEVAALHDNPWRIFRAKPRVLYFTTTGGGTTNIDSAAGAGSITIDGSAAAALRTHLGVAASGSITLTGSAANGVHTTLTNVTSAADASSISLTGSAANAVRTFITAAESGAISITGSASNGIYTPVGAINADAQSGAISVTGSSAIGRHDYLAAAGSGSVTITGSDANAVKSLGAVADSGSIAITGSNALAIRTWLASADAGSITLTGSSAVGVKATPGTGTLDPATIIAIADAVWDTELETGYTAREMMRIMFASLAGKRDGIGTDTEYYYDVATGLVPRVIFTPDINGNGTPVVDGS